MKLRIKKVLLIICLLLAIVKIVFAGLQPLIRRFPG